MELPSISYCQVTKQPIAHITHQASNWMQVSVINIILKYSKLQRMSIIDCTRTLIRQVVGSVKNDVLIALESSEEKGRVENVFVSPPPPPPDPFIGIETDALQSEYIRENFNYVHHRKVPLGRKLSRKKERGKKGPL